MADPARLSWGELLARVRSQHPDVYRAWFEMLQPAELRGGELRVVVEDPARARYLTEKCAGAFTDAAMSLTGHFVTLRFETVAPMVLSHNAHGTILKSMPLNPDYSFEQFVVGPSNRLAHAACRAVCSQPGTLYNPLFVHGPSGLGKSHLLQAIAMELGGSRPLAPRPSLNGDSPPPGVVPEAPMSVIYVSCETFVNEFVRAIEVGGLQEFRDSARSADVLVIDDAQFLANRESSQEELFHTFNVLYQSRRQIILSADSAPADIPTLEDRLVSRFNWGLVAQIDPPNRETRQAILHKKARLRGCEVPDEVLDFIAERLESNIRLLEGALTKLISETQIGGKPMNLETARTVIDGFDGAGTRLLQIHDILDLVSKHYGVRLPDLTGRKRSRSVSHPRQVGMYLARKLTPLSLEEIGGHFGGRDHSTVLHAERVIDASRRHDRDTADLLTHLTNLLLTKRARGAQ